MPQGQLPSVDARRFAMTPSAQIPRSAFDVVHMHKTTFAGNGLQPVYVDEVLPGDQLNLRMSAFCRTSQMLVPVMDNIRFESFFFFVPCRLVWSNWKRFMGEQANPTDSTQFLVPQVAPGFAVLLPGSIWDYMGVNMNNAGAGSLSVNALPFRAYNLIWNDWFRDEDLQTPVVVSTGDGPDTASDYAVLKRGKAHDYFTTARPWPQKPMTAQDTGLFGSLSTLIPGGAMTIPAASVVPVQIGAPVTGLGALIGSTPAGPSNVRETGGRDVTYTNLYGATSQVRFQATGAGVDSTLNVKVLINDMRTANMIQQWAERNARGGTRYTEIVRAHFGVISPDARLQRPEYLGGGRTFVNINPVTQTSPTGIAGTTTDLGEQAGQGTISAYDHGFSHSFTEHGYVIGMVNVRADLTYQQGVHKMWFRRSQFEFYWPELAHLGEQAVISKEIFCDGTAGDQNVFGYQERWAEYKYKPSRTSGYFRSTVPTPLDMWHLGQEFGVRPTLNAGFIEEAAPFDRSMVVAGNFNQQFLCDMMFQARWVRAMPMYSIPGMGSRF